MLHVIGQLGAGGLENQLHGLLSNMDAHGFDSSVVTFAQGGRFFEPIAALGVALTALPRRGLHRVRRLAAVLRREHPDVVYAWGTAAMVYGRLAGAFARVRVVTHDGSTGKLPTELRARLANLALLPLTAAFICNSERRAQELRRRLPVHGSRIAVIPNGVAVPERMAGEEDAARLRVELSLPGGPIVGCVGRLDRLKNQRAILDAVRLLEDRGLQASVVLVGRGSSAPEIETHAAALGISDRVRLVGEQRDVWSYLRGFAAFAFPSLLEGMPNALQEALATGVPCVAADVGDIGRLLDGGACGVLTPPGDVAALRDGLWRVLSDQPFAERIGRLGRQRMLDHYSMAALVRRTAVLMERVRKSAPFPFVPLIPAPEAAAACAS